MSKGLKALEHIKECPIYDPYQDSNSLDPSYTSLIKKEPYLAPYFRDVEKELKALEIIKKKTPDIYYVLSFIKFDTYDAHTAPSCESPKLTKEEFNLLKEVLLYE